MLGALSDAALTASCCLGFGERTIRWGGFAGDKQTHVLSDKCVFPCASQEEVRPTLGIGIEVSLRSSTLEAVQGIWKNLRHDLPEGDLSCSHPALTAALSIYIFHHGTPRLPQELGVVTKLKTHRCVIGSPPKQNACLKVTWACVEDSVAPEERTLKPAIPLSSSIPVVPPTQPCPLIQEAR